MDDPVIGTLAVSRPRDVIGRQGRIAGGRAGAARSPGRPRALGAHYRAPDEHRHLLIVLATPHDLRLRFALSPARQRHVIAFVDRHIAGALVVDDVRWH